MPATTLAQQRQQTGKGHARRAKSMIPNDARAEASRRARAGVRNPDKAAECGGRCGRRRVDQPSRPSSRGANSIGAYFAKYSANARLHALAATVVHGRYGRPGTRTGANLTSTAACTSR